MSWDKVYTKSIDGCTIHVNNQMRDNGSCGRLIFFFCSLCQVRGQWLKKQCLRNVEKVKSNKKVIGWSQKRKGATSLEVLWCLCQSWRVPIAYVVFSSFRQCPFSTSLSHLNYPNSVCSVHFRPLKVVLHVQTHSSKPHTQITSLWISFYGSGTWQQAELLIS